MNQPRPLRAWIHAHGARYVGLTICAICVVSLTLKLSAESIPDLETTKIISNRVAFIPLGILIVTFARTVLGIQTIGTFMPVLLALAISKVGISHSLMLITLVLLSGITLSFGLRSFKLLPMPRTASMIVIVVLMIQGYQHMSARLGLDTDQLFNSFPLIVLAWMVERLADLIDNQSVKDGVVRVLGSLSVSLACWFVFHIKNLTYFLNNYLEVYFAALGLMILLGTYTGLTLAEWVSYASLTDEGSLNNSSLEGASRYDHTASDDAASSCATSAHGASSHAVSSHAVSSRTDPDYANPDYADPDYADPDYADPDYADPDHTSSGDSRQPDPTRDGMGPRMG